MLNSFTKQLSMFVRSVGTLMLDIGERAFELMFPVVMSYR